jgi:hypothetical protein
MHMLDTIDIVKLARCSRALQQAACNHSAFEYALTKFPSSGKESVSCSSGLAVFLPRFFADFDRPFDPCVRETSIRCSHVHKLTRTFPGVRDLCLNHLEECGSTPDMGNQLALAFPRLRRLTVDSCKDQDWASLTHLREMVMFLRRGDIHAVKICHAPQLARLSIYMSCHGRKSTLEVSKLVAPQVRHLTIVTGQLWYASSFKGVDLDTLELSLDQYRDMDWSAFVAIPSLRLLTLRNYPARAASFLDQTRALRRTLHARDSGYIRLMLGACYSCKNITRCRDLMIHPGLVVSACCEARAQEWSLPSAVPHSPQTWIGTTLHQIYIVLRRMVHSVF